MLNLLIVKLFDLKVVTYETGTNQNSIGRASEILDIKVYKFSEVLREKLSFFLEILIL